MPAPAASDPTKLRALPDLVRDLLDERRGEGTDTPLLTEFLPHPINATATTLFRLLRESPPELVTRRVSRLLVFLARNDPRWSRLVTKSLTKHGRCPRPAAPGIRAQLVADDARTPKEQQRLRPPMPEAETAVQSLTFVRSRGGLFSRHADSAEIRLTTDSTNITNLSPLLNALALAHGVEHLALNFEGVEHLYVPGLAIVASWCRARAITPTIRNESAVTHEYLTGIGFYDCLRGERHFQSADDAGWRVAIATIDASVHPQHLASDFVGICDEHGFLGGGDRDALVIAFAELIENVKRHGGPTASGLVTAQFYPRRKKVTAVVVDTGIGIRQSFMEGDNLDARRRIIGGEDYLWLATCPLITSKRERHSGYGLYVVRESIARNGGTFALTSGPSTLSIWRDGVQLHSKRVSHSPWNGTVVCILFNLDNLIPISEVFENLPGGEGAEEDFFVDS